MRERSYNKYIWRAPPASSRFAFPPFFSNLPTRTRFHRRVLRRVAYIRTVALIQLGNRLSRRAIARFLRRKKTAILGSLVDFEALGFSYDAFFRDETRETEESERKRAIKGKKGEKEGEGAGKTNGRVERW